MSTENRFLLIVNPASGRMTLRQKLWHVLDRLSAARMIPTVRFTQKKGDAKRFAKECPKEFKTVVCAGGDGTLNEVVCGLMENPHHHVLGYLPTGTTNDLATSLGLSKDIYTACEDIITGMTRWLDIGSFAGDYFHYIASFGAFTEASYNTKQENKNLLGHLAYVLEGVMSLGNLRPYHVAFTFHGQTVEDDFIFASVSNTISMGGVWKFKEDMVRLDDGKLELLLVRAPTSFPHFQKIVSAVVQQDFSSDDVQLHQIDRLTVSTKEEIYWTLDGECHEGKSHLEIQAVPAAIEWIVPVATFPNLS